MSSDTAVPSASLEEISVALAAAEATRVPISPPSSTHAGLSLADAYAIQRLTLQRRIDGGARPVGHKVGLTSLAMQAQLGVDQPDFGVILDGMVVPEGGSIDVDTLISPRVEAEFVFRFGEDVPVGAGAEDIALRIDGVGLALEIIDSRVADWKITLVDTVADNASSARIVVGDLVTATPELLGGLPALDIVLRRDGAEVGRGPGSAVLGDPVVSLAWLASAIGRFGDGFRAGDVVLAGAVSAAVPLAPGAHWEATADGFPAVTLRSTAKGR